MENHQMAGSQRDEDTIDRMVSLGNYESDVFAEESNSPEPEEQGDEFDGEPVELFQWLQGWGDTLSRQQQLSTKTVTDGLKDITDRLTEISASMQVQSELLRSFASMSTVRPPTLPSTRTATLSERSSTRVNRQTTPSATSYVNNSTLVLAPSLRRPRFRGDDTKHPMSFLEDLSSYYRQAHTPDEDQLPVAMDCLAGNAKNWRDIYKHTWFTFADFRKDFVASFWSTSQQTRLRHDVSNGTWQPYKEETMLEHFTSYVAKAKQLTNPMTEDVLVAELMRHFPVRIQSLWQLRDESNVASAYEFLRKQETSVLQNQRTNTETTETAKHRFQPYRPPQNSQNRWRRNDQTKTSQSGNGDALNPAPSRTQPKAQ